MDVSVLYSFAATAPGRELPCAWLPHQGAGGLLAVAYAPDQAAAAVFSRSLSLLLLDLKTRSMVSEVLPPAPVPGIEALHLAYNDETATWVVGSVEFWQETSAYHVVLRSISRDEDGRGVLSEPFFNEQANDMAPIGPIFILTSRGSACTCLYRKSALDSIATPELRLERFDLITKQAEQTILDHAESALVCQQEQASLLLTLIPRRSVLAQAPEGTQREVMHFWGFALKSYGEDFDNLRWNRDLPGSLAGRRNVLGHGNDFEWIGINAAAIPGPRDPRTGRQTFVVAATMMDIFERRGYGHTSEEASRVAKAVANLACIDASGAIVQTCTDPIGLRPHLCLNGNLIVGVDLQAGQWRLWNWNPLYEGQLKTVVNLDSQVVRAHAIALRREERQDECYFWLIEEYREQVRVAKRDAATLREVAPSVSLHGVHLLAPQHESGSLGWHTAIEAMSYGEALVLLALDEHERLTLYQVG